MYTHIACLFKQRCAHVNVTLAHDAWLICN